MTVPRRRSEAPSQSPRGLRRVLFSAVALTIPVAFFVVAEIGLRVTGIAAYPPLFVSAQRSAAFLQPNERVIERFFVRPSQAPRVSIDTTYFSADKPVDTLRIVVQGGSSAAGFPYGKWASPAGMLGHRLRRSFPARNVEVISTAMSAINTYALLDFADEIVAQSPDAVLVYAGHNEFLGVLGVGSAFTSSRSRRLTLIIQQLRRLRVYRLVERMLGRARDEQPRSGTLMAAIAGERRIALDSDTYRRGVAQFRGNLDGLVGIYASAGIPVFIGTLASNEADQPPFIGDPSAGIDGHEWQTRLDAAESALEAGDTAAAVSGLEDLLAVDPTAADTWYTLGRALRDIDAGRSRDAFRRARDLDQLRFRAPSEFNDVVREVATAHGATVVDVESALAAESKHGIVGHEVMLEHLHPNVRGYFLLADAFYDALGAAALIDPAESLLDEAGAWRNQPVTEIDALAAGYRIDRLLADWPFRDERQPVSLPPADTPQAQIAQAWYTRRITWPEAMNRALVFYQQQDDLDNAVRVALNLAEAFHFLANVQYIAGQLLGQSGETAAAVGYLERAVDLERRADYQVALARAYLADGRADDAQRMLGAVVARDPQHEAARALMRRIDAGET